MEAVKNKECPICKQEFEFKIPERKDNGISTGEHYRHEQNGTVFFHKIPADQAIIVPYNGCEKQWSK